MILIVIVIIIIHCLTINHPIFIIFKIALRFLQSLLIMIAVLFSSDEIILNY